MKRDFLNELETELKKLEISKLEIEDIINDYSQLYDDALACNKTSEEISLLLGNPETIAKELIKAVQFSPHRSNNHKVTALMPFISLIIFMVLGLAFSLWHPGWLVFILIPITPILLQNNTKATIIALSPFIATLVFLLLGFQAGLWHPVWLIFLAIPLLSILLYTKGVDRLISLSPFVSSILFIIIGTYYGLWNPSWLIFLLIPMISILFRGNKKYVLVTELAALL